MVTDISKEGSNLVLKYALDFQGQAIPAKVSLVPDGANYKASFDLYLEALKGDVWTVEMTDRQFREIELFGRFVRRRGRQGCKGGEPTRILLHRRCEEVIRFDGYTTQEKVAIARGHLWPR